MPLGACSGQRLEAAEARSKSGVHGRRLRARPDEQRRGLRHCVRARAYPVQLRQYRSLDAKGTPFQRIRSVLAHDGSEVTYRFETARVGAISGYSGDGKDIFYGMCRRSASTTVCFDATWPREMQSMMGPVVERIAKRFRQGG